MFGKFKKESLLFKIILCILLSTIVILIFFILNKVIDKKIFRKYTIEKNSLLIHDIEKISINNNIFSIYGYAFMLNSDSKDSLISVFLKNTNDNSEIWLETKQYLRDDVNKFFIGEYNYEKSGFIATCKSNELKLSDCYEIIINIDRKNDVKKRTTVSTNYYTLNGELFTYNPNAFINPELNIKSDLLKNVFLYGDLCFFDNEIGMYVYQLDNYLYWILTDDFKFNEDGKTYIPYRLYTSQTNKLPEKQIKHMFENQDFYFEKFEYIDEDTYPYRVAIRNIPKDYVIANIRTGVFDRENYVWIWERDFHINHNLLNE